MSASTAVLPAPHALSSISTVCHELTVGRAVMGSPGCGRPNDWKPKELTGLWFAIDFRKLGRASIWAWADDAGHADAGRCDSTDAAVRAALRSVRNAVGRHHEVNSLVTFRSGTPGVDLDLFETPLLHLGTYRPEIERAGLADAAERVALAMVTREDLVETALSRSRRSIPGELIDGEIVIAVDGSVGATPSTGRAGGWGWISTEGFADAGYLAKVRTPVVAELAGIAKACAAAPSTASLRILCDSKDALRMIDAVLAGRASGIAAAAVSSKDRSDAIVALEAIRRRYGQSRPVVFEWVRGHSGHHLQEAADRLAVLGRRRTQAGLGDLSTYIAEVSRTWRAGHLSIQTTDLESA